MMVFSNATVVDGSASAPFKADVVIEGTRIVSILPPQSSDDGASIDCTNLVLCPGFVDIHGHSDLEVLRNPSMRKKIGQGITTEVAGNCGIGVFPAEIGDSLLAELTSDVLGRYPGAGWPSFSSYLTKLKEKGSGTNTAFLQAHSTLRSHAMEGKANRTATEEEIQRMCLYLQQSLEEGCIGLSSGLYYAPCIFADHKELLALLSVVASFDRLFSVHMRCEGSDILDSIQEVLDLARLSGVKLQISHLKVIGKKNQRLVPSMLALIEQARVEGVDVQFDQYPYEYGSTSLFSLLPPPYLKLGRSELKSALGSESERRIIKAMMEEGKGWDSIASLCGWDDIKVLVLHSNPQYEGLSMNEVAQLRNQDPYEAFFDVLVQEEGSALMTDVTQSQDSIKRILSHPLMCFGTDALYAGQKAHPRSYQAALHLLERYWKQEPVLSLEQLIAKMTSCGAKRLGLADRGLVSKGYKADLVLFDPVELADRSDDGHPDAPFNGLRLVMVNGTVAFQNGRYTDSTSGSILLG